MNKVFFIFVLLFASAMTFAQRPDRRAVSDRTVVNEDRGLAYIITTETRPNLSKIKRLLKLPNQFSIFLGDGWNDELRMSEPALSSLFANSVGLSIEMVEAAMNKKESGAAQFVEVPFSSPTGPITDLQIQQQIQSIANGDMRSSMGTGTVVMVYLDPSLRSRLTDLEAGKHYLAYENTVNINGSRIRYAVVPMDVNPKRAETIAQTAFVCASVDP